MAIGKYGPVTCRNSAGSDFGGVRRRPAFANDVRHPEHAESRTGHCHAASGSPAAFRRIVYNAGRHSLLDGYSSCLQSVANILAARRQSASNLMAACAVPCSAVS